MKIVVTNRISTEVKVTGLPEAGRVAAGTTRKFVCQPYILRGRDGAGHDVAAELRRLEEKGDIYFEIELDKFDVGLIGKKVVRVTTAMMVAKGAVVTANFDSDDAFPTHARLLFAHGDVKALFANSDAGYAAGTALMDFGTDTGGEGESFLSDIDVEVGSGAVGEVREANAGNYSGFPVGGKKLRVGITNSAAGATFAETTAGEVWGIAYYTVG